jgi:hypothetical protein
MEKDTLKTEVKEDLKIEERKAKSAFATMKEAVEKVTHRESKPEKEPNPNKPVKEAKPKKEPNPNKPVKEAKAEKPLGYNARRKARHAAKKAANA